TRPFRPTIRIFSCSRTTSSRRSVATAARTHISKRNRAPARSPRWLFKMTAIASTQTFGNYINGEWRSGGATFEDRNPANTDEVVGLFVKGTAKDVADAADAAAAAFPAWSSTNGPARGSILYKAADILDRRCDQVAADMTREEGKTLPEAKGELRRAINIFR